MRGPASTTCSIRIITAALALLTGRPALAAAPRADAPCEAFPELPFGSRPDYLLPGTIALTFDDGPDLVNTPKVLDVLAREGIRATFFINTENWTSLSRSEKARAVVRRIVAEGHTLGNHTVHHPHLGTLSKERIEREITGVEETVRAILGSEAPRLTLFRAPYGEPYTEKPRGPAFLKVAPIVARHAVHVGWNIDPRDYACREGDADCVLAAVKRQLDRGSYGIVLLHSPHAQTARALPGIIADMRRRGMRFVTVEDVVRARFGRSSAEVVDDPCHARLAGDGTTTSEAPRGPTREGS